MSARLEWRASPCGNCVACEIRKRAEVQLAEIDALVRPHIERARIERERRRYRRGLPSEYPGSPSDPDMKIVHRTVTAWLGLRRDLVADLLASTRTARACDFGYVLVEARS